jgi:hypothetical protein
VGVRLAWVGEVSPAAGSDLSRADLLRPALPPLALPPLALSPLALSPFVLFPLAPARLAALWSALFRQSPRPMAAS